MIWCVNPADDQLNEPEPDLIVLKRESATFVSGNPQPQDLNLVVEVSDSTLAFDFGVKAALYSRAGIIEYWVLDVAGRRLLCHREPASGSYGSITIYQEQEALSPVAAPHASFYPAHALAVLR